MKLIKKLKQYLTEKRLLYLLIIILISSTLIDMYTALSTPAFEIAEVNPIYVLTGSVTPLVILSVIIVYFISRTLVRSISIVKIFMYVMFTIYLSIGHGVGIASNVYADKEYNEDPEKFIEEAAKVKPTEKIGLYSGLIFFVMLLPIIISVVAFHIAMYFYGKRLPKREKIMMKIYGLAGMLYKK